MRKFLATLTFLCFGLSLFAQSNDRLKEQLASAKDDSTRFVSLRGLFYGYLWAYPDSSISYGQQEILLAKQMKSDINLSIAFSDYSMFYIIIGDYPQALRITQESVKLGEQSGNLLAIANAYSQLPVIYQDEGDYERALSYSKLSKSIIESHWTPSFSKSKNPYFFLDTVGTYIGILNGLSQAYENLNQLDSALKYIQIVGEAYETTVGKKWSAASYELGNIYSKKKSYPVALQHYRRGIALAADIDNKKDLMDNYNGIANNFKKMGELDSSIFYANKVLEVSKAARYLIAQLKALDLLADVYKSENKIDSVAKYLQLTIAAKDSLFSQQKVMQIQNMTFNEQLRQQEQAQQQQQLQNKIKLYSLLAALVVFLIIAFLLYRNNLHKQKAYALLQKQKVEIDIQKSKVEQTLEELKATQSQLVQSEKMASLGELTAGIAHEIQNPLNFVNNFSEVNGELISELVEEVDKGNYDEVKVIAVSLKDNEEKINHHGKRADAIVKGMLQHSKASTGKKELTDINKLADEYLRLSYHGLRAKDKSFNAEIKTDFDESIGKINIVPQDIGRVLLNLYNNAFYATNEKLTAHRSPLTDNYKPLVSVQTKKLNGKIEIKVSDNGNGIPQNIVDKIFQPFFTTKPTGQGTGLGLSLSYDIIKAHGGEIKVETKEGEGSEFVIRLPI